MPGHVLISPNRIVEAYLDLTDEELLQIWRIAKQVGRMLRKHYGVENVTYAFQDGPNAGQTVKHVHMHIIPKYSKESTDILDDDKRKERTEEERTEESKLYKTLLGKTT